MLALSQSHYILKVTNSTEVTEHANDDRAYGKCFEGIPIEYAHSLFDAGHKVRSLAAPKSARAR